MSGAGDPLAALRVRFLERCREDLAVLEVAEDDPGRVEPDVLRLTVHRLSGAAGTFGYAQVSRAAGLIDTRLHEGEPPTPRQIAGLIGALRAIL